VVRKLRSLGWLLLGVVFVVELVLAAIIFSS